MTNKELLKQYIKKKEEYLHYSIEYAINSGAKVPEEHLKIIDEKVNKAEREMLDISRRFIEGFIID